MLNRRQMLKISAAAAGAGLLAPWRGIDIGTLPPSEVGRLPIGLPMGGVPIARASAQLPQTPLPGKNIPHFVTALPTFVGTRVTGQTSLTVTMMEFQQMVLPGTVYAALAAPYNAGTYVWGYKVDTATDSYGPHWPGFTVEAQKGTAMTMTYINDLPAGGQVQQRITVDQSLHWANPSDVPMMVNGGGNADPYSAAPPAVVHLHGGEVPSEFDGGPDQWFTSASVPDGSQRGPGYRTLGNPPPNSAIFQYPNNQEAATLWFHDHCLGATRLNVYAGLAAYYWLRDEHDTGTTGTGLNLPADNYEIELAIQDRMFDTNGQLFFPDIGINPTMHPYWIPEFFGDVMVVNGTSWPVMTVEPRRYRFRMLDGCNARFLELRLMNRATKTPGPPVWVIGSDGGLLDTPVKLSDPLLSKGPLLLMAPGERADVIIDFNGYQGQTLTLINSAKAPYPKGTAPDPQTTGQIMQFVVSPLVGLVDPSYDPSSGVPLRGGVGQPPAIVRLASNGALATGVTASVTRQLTLNEVMGMGGPLEVLVNNTKWVGKRPAADPMMDSPTPIPGFAPDGQGNYLSELPLVGDTEVWEIVNLTADAHPIHLHLVQFQLINRQSFNVSQYNKAYAAQFPAGTFDGVTYPAGVFIPAYGPPLSYFDTTNPIVGGKLGGNPNVTPFLQGLPKLPLPEETGWKDTFRMFPGEVTRVVVRFAPQDIATATPGTNYFGTAPSGFDPTMNYPDVLSVQDDGTLGTPMQPPGYVWHCHIVDHEDNEMMRPYIPVGLSLLGVAGQNTFLPLVQNQ